MSMLRSSGHQLAVAHAGAEQPVHAVGPIVEQPARVDTGAAQPIRVGHHRDRRLDHRDRITVREGNCRVGEGRDQRAELFAVLRAFQDPGPRAAQERQRLQHLLQVRVVPILIEAEVVVTPIRHARMPFQDVAGQVEVEQLDFFLDGFREAVVHRGHQRGAGHQRVVFGLRPRIAGIDAEVVGALADGGNRILALPVGQGPPARIGGDQIHQMRGARARHPDDDERFLDRDRLDLGIPLDQLGQRQPVTQQPNHPLPQRRAGELGQAVVGLDRGDVRGQPIAEAVARRPDRRRPRPARRPRQASGRCRSRRAWLRCTPGSGAEPRSAGATTDRRRRCRDPKGSRGRSSSSTQRRMQTSAPRTGV